MVSSNTPDVLEIDEWITPATKYPTEGWYSYVGNVKIIRSKQKGGYYYFMEGVRGFDYYHPRKSIQITSLKIGKEVVMVDDPLHWYGMQDLAKNCKGKVLIGGLGLGLLLHALQDNKNVTSIHVIERDRDVVELMLENIPTDKRIKIIIGDFWEYVDKIALNLTETWLRNLDTSTGNQEISQKKIDYAEENKAPNDYDTVVMDMWWGSRSPEIQRSMFVLRMKLNVIMPNAKIMVWGLRDPELNPAVTKVVNY